MAEPFDPYDALDVDRDASDEAIKAAYRNAARRTHPDVAGGSRDAWDQVERAYGLLTDRKRRAHFDNTGFDTGRAADDNLAAAVNVLENAFREIANKALTEEADVDTLDVMKTLAEHMKATIARMLLQKAQAEKVLGVVKKMRARLRFKGKGPNMLGMVLEDRQHVVGRAIADAERSIVVHGEALKLLAFYDYSFVKPPDRYQGFTKDQLEVAARMLGQMPPDGLFGGVINPFPGV